ncbi:MAG: restriction endonuclease subunit S [Bacteroides sp.]|nr:restriction endonuclease subunit S [Bacteroides sp.]MCM1447992.1 restriction endonuclease subunit S [Bacteroides sp.]
MFLLLQQYENELLQKGAGAQHFNIGQDGLSKVCVDIPCLQEQQKIAKLLSLLDERIATQTESLRNCNP